MTIDPEIIQLSEAEHARARPAMYIGSPQPEEAPFAFMHNGCLTIENIVYTPALLTCFREALDNSIDIIKKTGGNGNINVTYDEKQKIISVSDNGPGIPYDYDEKLGGRIATVAVSATRTGSNFNERSGTAGMNGVGISVVNFISEWFILTSVRNKEKFIQKFHNHTGEFVTEDPVIEKTTDKNGTTVSFKVDADILPNAKLPTNMIENLLYLISATNTGINFRFNNKNIRTNRNQAKALFGSKNPMHTTLNLASGAIMDFYVLANDGYKEFSIVNNIPTLHGGKHIQEFRKQFAIGVIDALKRESNKRKLNPNKNDIFDGSFIFANVTMDNPEFDSQSKTRLVNSELAKEIYNVLKDFDWKQFIHGHQDWIDAMYERCSRRTGKADQAEVDRKAKALRKKKLVNLSDATSRNRKECTLSLFEGLSASEPYKAFRDIRTQAVMPLRGKIKNTHNATPKQSLASDTIQQICAACGLIPGRPVDVDELRYRQVQIWTDQDEDGHNISSSLIDLFYKWPELFDVDWLNENNNGQPFIVLAQTPLIILSKGKTLHYLYDDVGFSMEEWKKKGWKFVMRAKGLGALMPRHWEDHINDTKSKVAVVDIDGKLEEMLEIWFGNDSNARKEAME